MQTYRTPTVTQYILQNWLFNALFGLESSERAHFEANQNSNPMQLKWVNANLPYTYRNLEYTVKWFLMHYLA